VHDVPLSFR